jgi:hypothetical protein
MEAIDVPMISMAKQKPFSTIPTWYHIVRSPPTLVAMERESMPTQKGMQTGD